MIDLFSWVDQFIDFPQMSFLKPVFLVALVMLTVDLTFGFIFSLFGKFFGR